MKNKEFEARMKSDTHRLAPKLTAYHNKANIVDTALGKIERTKRPLITKLTLLRAAYHVTDADKTTEADAYREYLLKEATAIFNEIKRLDQEENEYKKLINSVNSLFVNDIKENI